MFKDQKKPSQEQQKFEQDDFIKISESKILFQWTILETGKLVHYDRKRGIVFLLNRDKPSVDSMTLYSLKIKEVISRDSDSDDGRKSKK